jgi:hypothetical protein
MVSVQESPYLSNTHEVTVLNELSGDNLYNILDCFLDGVPKMQKNEHLILETASIFPLSQSLSNQCRFGNNDVCLRFCFVKRR